MIKVQQRERDDCVRAAVASLLERTYEDVPNFARQAQESGRWWGSFVNEWLAEQCYPFRHANFAIGGNYDFSRASEVERWANGLPPRVYMASFWLDTPWWFATVRSKTQEDALHAVVMHGDEIAWDPGIHAEEPEYRAKPYYFVFANVFIVHDPLACRLGIAGNMGVPM